MNRLLLTTLTALLLTAAAHAAAPPPQWLPQDSWLGGKQYDARLEQTVKLWGTGVPAAEVFASITKQTGVQLAFSPPDDDNARICLNVYLNPKEPPTLRDLLVQIEWVMDCAWAVEGEGEQSRYVLLHTGMGEGAMDRLVADMQREAEAYRRREEQVGREASAKAAGKLRELESGLALSREEAIREYRDQDDLLLLALLDPPRHAFARFLVTLSDTALARLEAGETWEADWEQLTSGQRDLLREAMRPCVEERRREQEQGRIFDENWADWAAIEALGLHVELSLGGSNGGFRARTSYTLINPDGGKEQRGITLPSLQLATDPRLPSAMGEAVEADGLLRRLLGERIPDEQMREAREQWYRRYLDQLRRRRAEAELARLPPLSPENAALLSALRLPVQADRRYALWQLEEAVAAASGRHVISDCFFQPAEPLSRRIDLLSPGRPPDLTALTVLRLASFSWATPLDLSQQFGLVPEPGTEGWEWGDAGAFVRFRSRNRDAWRAGFLPARAVAALDAWIVPHLLRNAVTGERLPEVEFPLDLHEMSVLLTELSATQRQWGGLVCYGDPSDETQQYARVLREAVLTAWTLQPWSFPFFARLSREQVQQLDAGGLTCEVDVSLLDVPADLREWWVDNVKRGDVVRFDRIGSGEAGFPPDRERPAADYRATVWSHFWLMHPDGRGSTGGPIPRNLILRPQRLPHLVPPPDGAAPPG